MGDHIRIRPAELGDLAGTRALLVATWHDTYDALLGAERVTEITDRWHSLDNLSRQIAESQTSFLVAVQSEDIVGHALADARDSPLLRLSRLYVHPACQRRGIGTGLLDAVIARHPVCDAITLEVQADNDKAIAFYQRHGFRTVRATTEDGIDHLEMTRQLRRA